MLCRETQLNVYKQAKPSQANACVSCNRIAQQEANAAIHVACWEGKGSINSTNNSDVGMGASQRLLFLYLIPGELQTPLPHPYCPSPPLLPSSEYISVPNNVPLLLDSFCNMLGSAAGPSSARPID
ncbi:hypothetical protein J6590_001570 [Homalodisca vitripennis]|nr:hypothetical protein J6590_001570 [Homalodisca vitripennis]